MSNKQIFMFSGQGSQYYQMGKELYQRNNSFKHWMNVCNEIASELLHTSLIDTIYPEDKKGQAFDRLLYTNPALISIQYSLAKMLNDKGIYADYLMGYSLGEVAASVVSEAISLEGGLKLVIEMAQLAEQKSPKAKMLAIVAEKIIVANDPMLFSKCWITGTNFPGNFVVCGLPEDIDILQKELQGDGITTQLLPVNTGFHTPLINDFEEEFKQSIKKLPRKKSKTPVISSCKQQILEELNDDYFWEVIRYPVNFMNTVETVVAKEDYVFIDLGPSGSLATSIKYILPSNSVSMPFQILNQFGKNLVMLEKLEKNLSVGS